MLGETSSTGIDSHSVGMLIFSIGIFFALFILANSLDCMPFHDHLLYASE